MARGGRGHIRALRSPRRAPALARVLSSAVSQRQPPPRWLWVGVGYDVPRCACRRVEGALLCVVVGAPQLPPYERARGLPYLAGYLSTSATRSRRRQLPSCSRCLAAPAGAATAVLRSSPARANSGGEHANKLKKPPNLSLLPRRFVVTGCGGEVFNIEPFPEKLSAPPGP